MEETAKKDILLQLKGFDLEKDILIVDPYAINIPDLKEIGVQNVVRIRRPFWGTGRVSEFIRSISYKDLKNILEKLNYVRN